MGKLHLVHSASATRKHAKIALSGSSVLEVSGTSNSGHVRFMAKTHTVRKSANMVCCMLGLWPRRNVQRLAEHTADAVIAEDAGVAGAFLILELCISMHFRFINK